MFASSTGYIAGFVNPEVSNRMDLFDVFVNLPDSTITVSQSAKGSMRSKREQYVALILSDWCWVSHNRSHGYGEVAQGHRPTHRAVCGGRREVRQSGDQGKNVVKNTGQERVSCKKPSLKSNVPFICRTFLSRLKRSSLTWLLLLMSVKTLKSHWKV